LILKDNAAVIIEHFRAMTILVQSLVQQNSQKTVKSAYHLLLETVTMVVFVVQVMAESVLLISLAIVMVYLRTAMIHIFPFLVHRFVPKLPPTTWIHVILIVDFNVIMVMLLLVKMIWMSLKLYRSISKSSVHATTVHFPAIVMLVLSLVLMLNQCLDPHAHLSSHSVVDTMNIVVMALIAKIVLQ